MLTLDEAEPARGIGDNGGPPLLELFTKPQFQLIHATARYPAMVAGFGAGKTEALVKRALKLKFAYPGQNIAYYLPTYDLVNTIAFPRFEDALAAYGMIEGEDYKTIKNNTPMIRIIGGGHIIFRTMDRPGRIVGYEVADSLVDELDTLKEKDAADVWRRILSRNRQKKPDGSDNTVAVGTTPEGFKFVYSKWKKDPPSDQYVIIKASTYSNARNLPPEYIPDLLADYPTQLIQAYLDGEFVNLTSGSVYSNYNREANRSFETIKPGEALHIGMDFNVGKMAGVVFVGRQSAKHYDPHAVAEIMGVLDTPAMIAAIKARFPNHAIFIYPDASGASRKTNNASTSDLALLQQAGFNVLNNAANPAVKDRILAMNIMLAGCSRGKLYVNDNACPLFAEALEKQAYDEKTGEPDKKSGLDHPNDAGGYFVTYRYPVLDGRVIKVKLGGV